MAQKLAALVMMFGGSTFALAQTAASPEVPQTPAEVDAEIENDIANAEVSTAQYSAELGVAFRKGPGPELRLNWYRDDDQIYGLKIGQYAGKDVSHFDTLALMTVGVQSRFSLEGSFYIEGGIDLTSMEGTIDEQEETTSTGGTGTFGFEGKVSQTFLQMGFGNQWQSGTFTYGVDWVNLYIPFSGSSFKTSSTGTIVDREQRERRSKRDFKTEAWDINYGLSLHAGIMF